MGWACLAADMLQHGKVYVVCLLNFFLGMAGANFAVANSRLAMSVMPVMGRNHFFALFTVFASLATGLAPICSGIVLDALQDFHFKIAGASIDRYALYFLFSSLILITACRRVSVLEEGKLTPPNYWRTRMNLLFGLQSRTSLKYFPALGDDVFVGTTTWNHW